MDREARLQPHFILQSIHAYQKWDAVFGFDISLNDDPLDRMSS